MTTTSRRPALAALCVGGVVLLSGCTIPSLTSVQLPGGAASGQNQYDVVAIFPDVYDLVPQAAVRVDDVAVGSVKSIDLDTKTLQARVTLIIKSSVKLPDNSLAELRQTSLLGEKYVSLESPTDAAPSTTNLKEGSVIPSQDTGRTPEVEEVFTALSDLLSGGGIGQLQNIAVEITATLQNRESGVRDTLTNLNTFVATIDARKDQVIDVLGSIDKLSATLVTQRQTIDQAIDTISPAVEALANQQADLTALLQKLSNLGAVATDVINQSKDNTIADLKDLEPTLALAATLQPEVDKLTATTSATAAVLRKAIPGDYLQLFLHANIYTNSVGTIVTDPLGAVPPLPTLPVVGSVPVPGTAAVPKTGTNALKVLGGVK